MMKNRQVEVNLLPRRGEDMHVEETIFGGQNFLQHSEECVRCVRNVDRPTGRIDLATQLGSSCSCCVGVVMNFAFRRPCCLTLITHSSIAILLIWLMKPNVFELRAPIRKVAMLGCYRDVVNLCACVFLPHFV